MLLDSSSTTDSVPGTPGPGMAPDKVRIRFRKDGLLRLVSHHDLMHCFERMFRRAEIPFRSTQGFHPQPRIVFALSLALGIVGNEEVAEVELEHAVDPAEIHHCLKEHSPPGLDILSVRRIDLRSKAQVTRVCYRVAVPGDCRAQLPRQIAELLNCAHCWTERTRPRPRRLDLRPFIHDLRLVEDHLEMDLWVSGNGMARPEEILHLLGLAGILDEGAILERSKMTLRDEQPETDARPPGLAQEGPQPAGEARKEKGPRPAPLLPGPLSFDT